MMFDDEDVELGIVKQPADLDVELRDQPEHDSSRGGDGERDNEAGAVHARWV